MSRPIIMAAGLALAVTLSAVSAQAQAIRTFVSTAGSDSNPCNITQPCRHFQAAVNATSAGGEVDALDPGAYGSFTISQAISIEGQGWSYVAPPNNGAAITINAASGTVSIRGVSLNGVGTSGITNGILFNAGGSLNVQDSSIRNFSNAGILMQPTAGAVSFAITNTIVANNTFTGLYYLPPSGSATVNGVIDHVVATNNQYGILINTASGGGATTVAISNSVASNNISTGIYLRNASASFAASIDNTGLTGNFNGIEAFNTVNVTLGRSVIASNANDGTYNNTSPNTFYSYQDNRINGNTTDVAGTALNSHALR
jgi:hypothetical protein